MSWGVYILVISVLIVICVAVYFLFRKKLDKEERKLVRFLKKSGGEVNPRFVKDDMGVSRDWLESVSGRLEKKGLVVRWGWRVKSLICLKGNVVKREKDVLKLLKKNGGMMAAADVALKLGFAKDYFYRYVVEKMKDKGVVYVRRKGSENFLVLENSVVGGRSVGVSDVKLSNGEERLVKILRRSGGEMMDVGLALRTREADKIIKSLVKKGVVFRWGLKKTKVCLKDILSEKEERIVGILRDNDGEMFLRDLIKSGFNKVSLWRILNKLEVRGRIIRKKIDGDFIVISLVL